MLTEAGSEAWRGDMPKTSDRGAGNPARVIAGRPLRHAGAQRQVDQRHGPSVTAAACHLTVLRARKGAAPQIKRPLTAPDIENLEGSARYNDHGSKSRNKFRGKSSDVVYDVVM